MAAGHAAGRSVLQSPSRAEIMRCLRAGFSSLILLIGLASPGLAESEKLDPLVQAIRDVDRDGKGHRAAAEAVAKLTASANADRLPVLLASMDGASPLAINWLRGAFDTIAERQLRDTGKLPTAELERFLADKSHDQRARRLAYEWVARADASAAGRLIPTMLDDPSLEMRRDAVAQVLATAEKADEAKDATAALANYQKALAAARDLDQIKTVTEALKKLGKPVDLPSHFGFILDWKLIGPFDNRSGKGFDKAYPPEESVDLSASYPVEEGKVAWKDHHTDQEYGQVDLNKAIGKHMGAAAYAYAEFIADKAAVVELRLGTVGAYKVWLNGKLLSWADVYHANDLLDQYVGRGELKPGKNVILIKVCQNEQKEDWAQDWRFQLRVCDPSGKAILSTDRKPPSATQTAARSAETQSTEQK